MGEFLFCTNDTIDRYRLIEPLGQGGQASVRRACFLAICERVSDDNPFADALFRTLKYRPGYPRKPFKPLELAREWVAGIVAWCNSEQLHSGIRYVTPADRHAGRDATILAARRQLYAAARKRTPRRWSGRTRNWMPMGAVYLNPARATDRMEPLALPIS